MAGKTTRAAAEIGAQFARLGSKPEPAAAGPMPAEQATAKRWDARASLTLTAEMKRALDMARAIDGIPDTARIRAMISLWQDDERLRARVNKLAKSRLT